MGLAYNFGGPEIVGATFLVADDEAASLADWLTDSLRLAGSGGEWSGGAPWGGSERGEVARVWLHDPGSGDPPVRGIRIRTDEGTTVGLILGAARRWRDDLRNGTAGSYTEGVAPSGHIV